MVCVTLPAGRVANYARARLASSPYARRVSKATPIQSEWFRNRMRERGTTMLRIAERLNRDESVVSKIVSGRLRMHLWQVPDFAAELGVTETEILRRAGVEAPAMVPVPVISWVAASQFAEVGEAIEFSEEYPRVPLHYPSATVFGLHVVGDSMDRVAPEGSLIVVDYALKELKDRDLAVLSRCGETTFKRFRCDDRGVWFEPESFNTRHAPIVPTGEEEIVVVGRVVAIPQVARFVGASPA